MRSLSLQALTTLLCGFSGEGWRCSDFNFRALEEIPRLSVLDGYLERFLRVAAFQSQRLTYSQSRGEEIMQKVRWAAWRQVERSLRLSHSTSTSLTCLFPSWKRSIPSSSPFSTSSEGEPPKDAEKPPRPKKMKKRDRFGTYDKSFEDELDMVPLEEGITHLYNTRGIVDKWLGHPTLDSIFPDKDLYAKGASPNVDPPGEGPILRWTTRVVLGPGGDAWHPANRKVKLAVFLKELQLTEKAKERLLLIVGKRYNPSHDELTITSERFDLREENRKDVLRTLYALIDEANTANINALQSDTAVPMSS